MHTHRVIHKLHHTHNNVYNMYLYLVMCVVKHYLKGKVAFSLKILSLTSREIGYKMETNVLERVIIGGYFHTAFFLDSPRNRGKNL